MAELMERRADRIPEWSPRDDADPGHRFDCGNRGGAAFNLVTLRIVDAYQHQPAR